MPIDYISSSEVVFLKKMARKVGRGRKTKLVLRFLGEDDVEPTTQQPYKTLLENLSALRPFCSGILVPKTYIWPINEARYLGQPTDLVVEAHWLGLEVFAYTFANDLSGSYNYSYNPTAEYLQFVGGSDFAVDGVLTDFPSTASEAIGELIWAPLSPTQTETHSLSLSKTLVYLFHGAACFSQAGTSGSGSKGKALVISHNGASGEFADSTDLAYQKAAADGADIIDCSVQMTSDGITFCLGSPCLTSSTTASTTFMPRSTLVPEIQPNSGIFSFDLTWDEVQSLKRKPRLLYTILDRLIFCCRSFASLLVCRPAELKSPLQQGNLPRNPAMKSAGKFTKLSEFLDFAKTSSVQGVLVSIEVGRFGRS